MAINLGGAGPQREGAGSIPPSSIVRVCCELREASGEFTTGHPLVFRARSGLQGLDIIFHVNAGQFEGRKIYESFWIPPFLQDIELSAGQAGSCRDGHSKIQAMVEACRGIHPDEVNDAARSINDWSDLNGMVFPVKVGAKVDGEYIKNNILRIIGLDKEEEYNTVMNGGEYITDKPLPVIPAAKNQQPQTQSGYQTKQPQGGGGYQANPKTQSGYQTKQPQGNSTNTAPKWAQRSK